MKGKNFQDFLTVLSITANVLTIWHDARALAVVLALAIAYYLDR